MSSGSANSTRSLVGETVLPRALQLDWAGRCAPNLDTRCAIGRLPLTLACSPCVSRNRTL
eukprot:3665596-Lingulodinium_polyedra.AAC.1